MCIYLILVDPLSQEDAVEQLCAQYSHQNVDHEISYCLDRLEKIRPTNLGSINSLCPLYIQVVTLSD